MTTVGIIGIVIGIVMFCLKDTFTNVKNFVFSAILFILGGVFIGIGGNPAKGMPNGSPEMVAIGFICMFMGILLIAIPCLLRGAKTSIAKKIVIVCTVVAVIATAVGFYIAFENSGSQSSKGNGYGSYDNVGTVTCPNCGTGYREGHAAANFIEKYGYCSYCNGKDWG